MLEYVNDRATVAITALDDWDLDFDTPGANRRSGQRSAELSEACVREQLVPQLAAYVKQKLDSLSSPALLDYRFSFWGKFQTDTGELKLPIFHSVDQEKRARLLANISAYVTELFADESGPTEPLETFFLSRHLLDEALFPELDAEKGRAVFERILDVNKSDKERQAEHRANIVNALRQWAEEQFLPRYFDITAKPWQEKQYTKKSGLDPASIAESEMELLLYTGVAIIKHEPAYSRQSGVALLERAVELGSKRASLLMKEGSGTIAREVAFYRDELVECKANDVFATVTIAIRQEAAESYARALRFLCALLQHGFPKSYQIKLKSGVKQFLPIKGLAKSATHRFFANALAYPPLHPLLADYAREAMEQFAWYADADDEKNVMPGSYAVFGLGLADRRYFSLVEDYMGKIDEEHQSAKNQFTAAFAKNARRESRDAANACRVPAARNGRAEAEKLRPSWRRRPISACCSICCALASRMKRSTSSLSSGAAWRSSRLRLPKQREKRQDC